MSKLLKIVIVIASGIAGFFLLVSGCLAIGAKDQSSPLLAAGCLLLGLIMLGIAWAVATKIADPEVYSSLPQEEHKVVNLGNTKTKPKIHDLS